MVYFDKLTLISCVRDRPIIWDQTHEMFSNKLKRRKAWHEVFKEVIEGFEDMDQEGQTCYGSAVMKKWTNIKDCFKRSERNYKKAMDSGSGRHSTTEYVYSKHLQFLKSNLGECSTGDISDNDNDESDSVIIHSLPEVVINNKNSPTIDSLNPGVMNKKRKYELVELGVIKDNPDLKEKSDLIEKPDRHMSFFNGIVPSLRKFDDDEIVEFQLSVLQVLSDMKKRKKSIGNQ